MLIIPYLLTHYATGLFFYPLKKSEKQVFWG